MKKKIKKFNPFILSKIGRHFDHGMSWIRTSAVVEHPPREIYWNPMVGSQSKMNSNIGLGFGFFSESTVVAQITYLEGTDSFSEILKARLFFFSKIHAWHYASNVEISQWSFDCDIQKSDWIWVPSTFTKKWKCEPLMALTTETFVSIANLPSTSGSL